MCPFRLPDFSDGSWGTHRLPDSEDEYADITEDDEQAFAHLEKAFRTKLFDALDVSNTGGIVGAAYREYI
jgi:hypothetical protein